MHCKNYACKLITCACICADCTSVKSYVPEPEPCKTCGTCPTCGRSYYAAPPIYWYPTNPWWCFTCQMYHPYGFQCYNPFTVNPFVTYTTPYINIGTTSYINTGLDNIVPTDFGVANAGGFSPTNILTWTAGVSSENGNINS